MLRLYNSESIGGSPLFPQASTIRPVVFELSAAPHPCGRHAVLSPGSDRAAPGCDHRPADTDTEQQVLAEFWVRH